MSFTIFNRCGSAVDIVASGHPSLIRLDNDCKITLNKPWIGGRLVSMTRTDTGKQISHTCSRGIFRIDAEGFGSIDKTRRINHLEDWTDPDPALQERREKIGKVVKVVIDILRACTHPRY